ncbi:hypothetical protein [Streptosporangium carneum]|uniref:Uncharacterized protein n=1 Tax=Streptosporangium carneum TaxID=47481 RepID=A0A9W6MI29_9ACTN|nr:hypothetical protein [Streptosporangium carneum]GLK14906.1 hypothetical protein GCM10017600_83190 [Streptosporangium carneum]
MNEAAVAAEAIDRLRAELVGLGVTGVYEVGDDGTLSVWIGLVVRFRDGFYRWQEGRVKRRHLATDPGGCAVRVARRYVELQADVPTWWDELARTLRGDVAEDYP